MRRGCVGDGNHQHFGASPLREPRLRPRQKTLSILPQRRRRTQAQIVAAMIGLSREGDWGGRRKGLDMA